jgi:hypothetical protein
MNAAWASCPRWRNASLRISIIYAGRYITSLDSKTKTEGSYPGYTPGFFLFIQEVCVSRKIENRLPNKCILHQQIRKRQ